MLANDQAIKWAKAKVCVYADSVLCVGQVKDIPGSVQRWKGQIEDLKMCSSYRDAVGIDGEAIEFEWKRFSKDFRHCLFFARFNETWRQRTSSQKTSRTGSSSCQCSMASSGKGMHVECRKDQELRDEFLAKTLDVSGSRVGREMVWRFTRSKRTMELHSQQMAQRFKETGHLVFKSTSALSRGILKQRKGRRTIHFNGDSMNTELLFQTINSFCKSAQCLRSSYELVLPIRFE